MSDIFISYARSTADQAQAIAEALRGLGYGVWRDDEIPANRAYADVIAGRLPGGKWADTVATPLPVAGAPYYVEEVDALAAD